jgi:biopolymer transport protein ExbD
MAGGGSDEDNPVPLNVTPLIDIIFCLIIFFMCSFHFKQLEGKIESWLPKDKGVQGTPLANPVLEEIRVILAVDKDTRVVVRKLGANPMDDDAELGKNILAMHEDFEKLGKKDIPVIIDAMPPVPWKDVINVMNIAKTCNMKIEFAAPLPPGTPGS